MTYPLQPRDDLDGFCSYPSCGLLGTHSVERTVFEMLRIPGQDGSLVDCPKLSDPPNGTPLVRRTCLFCGHAWGRTAQEAAS